MIKLKRFNESVSRRLTSEDSEEYFMEFIDSGNMSFIESKYYSFAKDKYIKSSFSIVGEFEGESTTIETNDDLDEFTLLL